MEFFANTNYEHEQRMAPLSLISLIPLFSLVSLSSLLPLISLISLLSLVPLGSLFALILLINVQAHRENLSLRASVVYAHLWRKSRSIATRPLLLDASATQTYSKIMVQHPLSLRIPAFILQAKFNEPGRNNLRATIKINDAISRSRCLISMNRMGLMFSSISNQTLGRLPV